MSKINDGGPAYPLFAQIRDENGDLVKSENYFGMTVRQVYAVEAMKALIESVVENPEVMRTLQEHAERYSIFAQDEIAIYAFAQADAMIAFEANERGPE